MSVNYQIRSGDTLGQIAARHGTTVGALAKANGIANADRIVAGKSIVIPGKADVFVDPPAGKPIPAGQTPMFAQNDPRWSGRRLGNSASVGGAGCAMTAIAMAISKTSGKPINPGELDAFLDRNRGYVGDGVVWSVAASTRGLTARKEPFTRANIDRELAAGRPVVIGVDYKAGNYGGANGTDHWITITGKEVKGGTTYYLANDPWGGKAIRLEANGNQLSGPGSLGRYRTTGQLVTVR